MEISNKTLAWLVVAAIAISVIGTGISMSKLGQSNGITGYAAGTTSNTTGNASVTVTTSTILRFAIASLNFGSGGVNTAGGYASCNVSTNDSVTGTLQTAGCTGFGGTTPALVLENAGNTHMNITLNFSSNASVFLGGTNPSLKYTVSSNETSSCNSGLAPLGWTEVTSNSILVICTNLSWADTGDSLKIGLNISIPQDALQGAKSLNITAQGTSLY